MFSVLIGCFGGMNLLAGILLALDILKKRSLMRTIKSAECGFRALKDGAWTWTFAMPVRGEEALRALPPPCGAVVRPKSLSAMCTQRT